MQKLLPTHRSFSSKILNYNGKNDALSKTKKWDYIIIGGGHNGLVCANYLVKQSPQSKILIA